MLVIKIGGPAGIDYARFARACATHDGEPFVVVHGGNDELDRLSTALNHPPKTIVSESGISSRFSDERTMDHFLMAYCGKTNKRLVGLLQKNGVRAVGLSAMDGGIARAKRKDVLRVREGNKIKILRGDHSGKISSIDVRLLLMLLQNGFLPVLCPPALGENGEPINVDGDRLSAELAGALGAHTMILLSNVPGLLEKFPDETSLIHRIPREKINAYQSVAQGRMKKKIIGCTEALDKGVKRVILADARAENPIANALLGNGTVIE